MIDDALPVEGGFSGLSQVFITQKGIEKRFYSHEPYQQELRFLKILTGRAHFPTVIESDNSNNTIILKHAGEIISNNNCPEDYKEQLRDIIDTLHSLNIFHNDMTLNNILVSPQQTITLIDFGWGSFDSPGFPYINIKPDNINFSTKILGICAQLIAEHLERATRAPAVR